MSIENAVRFLLVVEKDEKLNSKFREATNKFEDKTLSEKDKEKVFTEEILPIAKEIGFEVTYDDFKELDMSAKGHKLSDEQLGNVVAGSADATETNPPYHYWKN